MVESSLSTMPHINPQQRAVEAFSRDFQRFRHGVIFDSMESFWSRLFADKKQEVFMAKNVKCSLYLNEEDSKMIDRHLEMADKRTRSEFVRTAIREYCCELDSNSNREILGQEVMRVCKAAVKDSENRLCNYLFKMAGEMGLLSYLVGADLINMTDEEINQCRRKVFEVVRRERGMIKLENVVKEERAIAESGY